MLRITSVGVVNMDSEFEVDTIIKVLSVDLQEECELAYELQREGLHSLAQSHHERINTLTNEIMELKTHQQSTNNLVAM